MMKKIKSFLERDDDITYRIEFSYIYITVKETLKILYLNMEDFIMTKIVNVLYSIF